MSGRLGQPAKAALPRSKCWPVNRFYISKQNRLLYCPIPKVACTSLKVWWAEFERGPQSFQDVAGPELHHHLEVQFGYGQHADELGDDPLDDPRWFRFAFVRNPWARLVSAFVSKFVRWNPVAGQLVDEFRRRLPNRIVRQLFRRQDPEDRLAPWWLFRSAAAWSERFTFRQFVNHLAACDLTQVDGHWRPQTEFLRPVKFQFIGRFEQLDRDFAELNRRLGRQPDLPRRNITPYTDDDSMEACVADCPLWRLRQLSAAPHYRRFYTSALVETVGRLYESDVQRFGYEFDQETETACSVEHSVAAARRRPVRVA
jgi:hypothetical protein